MRFSARLVLLAPLVVVSPAVADQECVKVEAQMTPSDSLQLVAWVETVDGTFVDTLFITAKTGLYGLGNRPGRYDFNSGPPPDPSRGVDDIWPYGRRVTTFPVWAHRHGMTWPKVVFQDGAENNLSHAVGQSSPEATPPYCRPSLSTAGGNDHVIWDTGTCASMAFTDKGKLSLTETSLYPPRADLTRQTADSSSVAMYNELNPFDAITRATPKGGQPLSISWPVPKGMPAGTYVLYVEASKEFDFNPTYNPTVYPSPNVSYGDYGQPYRGQPSVVYEVPFELGATGSTSVAQDYAGYGDPTGDTGVLHVPDATITTDTPGSGALRLQLVSDSGQMFRLRVSTNPQVDFSAPGMPGDFVTTAVATTSATLRFVEPGDDGLVGAVTRYDIRVRANEPITDDNFDDSMPVVANVTPAAPGRLATFEIAGLLPETDYYVAVRPYDDCYNRGPLATLHVTTADRVVGSVDACFIATAAYGSLMANDVELLRHFRDSALSTTILGELAIETYYTFGPAVAGVVGESDVLRATARAVLHPIIERVRRFEF